MAAGIGDEIFDQIHDAMSHTFHRTRNVQNRTLNERINEKVEALNTIDNLERFKTIAKKIVDEDILGDDEISFMGDVLVSKIREFIDRNRIPEEANDEERGGLSAILLGYIIGRAEERAGELEEQVGGRRKSRRRARRRSHRKSRGRKSRRAQRKGRKTRGRRAYR